MLASAAVAFSLLVFAGQSVPSGVGPGEATELSDVVVIGQPATGLLTVEVDGDAGARTLVTSEPDLRCGPDEYRWEAYGRPRLCWLRRRLDTTVVLLATRSGQPGADWVVDWDGCTRVIGPDRCEVDIQPLNRVRATYRRPG